MSRRSLRPTRPPAAARTAVSQAAPLAPRVERPAGSPALVNLLRPAAVAPARLSAGDVLWLQRNAGNEAVSTLVDRDRPVAQPAPQGPADVNVGFNPMDINHRLLIAIDQKQIDFRTRTRHVDFDAVVDALGNLTAAEAHQVMDAYLAHEDRTLYNDLFGAGESGAPTDLSHDQLMRIDALLSGTKAGPGASQAEARAVAVHRMEADVYELHALLHGDLETPQIERVLTLLRRPEAANAELGGVYEREVHAELRGELMRLGYPGSLRASLLLAGNAVMADSIQVGADRARIAAIDDRIRELGESGAGVMAQAAAAVETDRLRKERREVVDRIEQRLRAAAAEARDDALAKGEGAERAQQAAAERAGAVAGDAAALAAARQG